MGAERVIPDWVKEAIRERDDRLKADFCRTQNAFAVRDGDEILFPEDLEIVSYKREGKNTFIRYRRVKHDSENH